MIEHNSKIPPKHPKQKGGMSTFTQKSQRVPDKSSLSISGSKTEAQTNRKILNKDCFGDVGVPVRPGRSVEENSEAEKVLNRGSKLQDKIYSDKAIDRPRNRQNVSGSTVNKIFQKNAHSSEKNEHLDKLIQSAPKISARSLQIKKTSGISGRKKDQNEKSHQVKYLPVPKRSIIFKRTNSRQLLDNKKRPPSHTNMEMSSKETTNRTVEPYRRKPSEIPLRKSRIDGSRKPKPVSMLLKKTFEEEESSIDFYLDKKTFSPIDEVSLCSELQITIDAISDCDKLDHNDTKSSSRDSHGPVTREKVFNIRLERSSKHSNIPFDFIEENRNTGKKVKKLDLEKVKTSSFTVLQNDSSAFTRLESLHKQNILNKKKLNVVNQKKSKPLTPKQFFNSVSRRSSKRSLGSRLPGVRNKSSLYDKRKKNKNESQEKGFPLGLSQLDWEILSEFLSGKKLKFYPYYCERKTNRIQYPNHNLSKKEISNSLREKLDRWDQKFLRKIRSPVEKVKSKIPTPKKRIQFQDLRSKIPQDIATPEKSKPVSNPVANTKKVESFGYTKPKPKITTPSVPPPVPNHDEKSSNRKNDEKIINKSENGKNTTGKPERKRTVSKKEDPELIVKGTALEIEKEPSPEKTNSKTKVKVQLKIDLNLQDEAEDSKTMDSCDWLFKNDNSESSNKLPRVEKIDSTCSVSPSEMTKIIDKTENSDLKNITEDYLRLGENPSLLLREKFLSNTSTKEDKKKNNRSDAGDRPLPPFNPPFASSLSLQNKAKVDHKARNTIKKSYAKEDQKEIFEEEGPVKVRRRNSEPISLSGYVCKRSAFPIFRAHKPSVSSLASSLRHLNTDDFDDFVFWEPVPQKMTSCWEMSLYQFKKPWSVLSCSVFRDNRLSNTPGFILENLKNGGTLSERTSAGSHSERVNCAKDNPFDVEPSIAQKNIDIRNWLAALNFPTSSSNSSDIITEVNFSAQPIVDSQNLNKAQVTPKRRKVIRNIKLPEKVSKILAKDKNQCIRLIRNPKEEELKEAIRGKSGGFVIAERFSSRSAEEKSIFSKTNDRNTSSQPEVFTKPEHSYKFQTAESGTMIDETLYRSNRIDGQQQSKVMKKSVFYRILRGTFKMRNSSFVVIFALLITLISFAMVTVYPIVSVYFIHN